MATSIVLGRRLLASVAATKPAASTDEPKDELLRSIQQHDRFFCETMELIPAQFYFPTDEEENWKKSAPKSSKKYHRDTLAQKQLASSKKLSKKAKLNPNEQKTNEERQLETADEEKKQKQTPAVTKKVVPAKDPSSVSIDGLKERLAAKLAAMREQRKADEKDGKKRKANANAKAEPASKKRKATASNGSAFNNKSKAAETNGTSSTDATHTNGTSAASEPVEVSATSISYGSLLLADEGKKVVKKTRNGQSVRGIQNLLKKAERNQERMEELKKTEEGKALVQAKNWNKAIKQAAGELVLDDPKLLRKKLKKKEKAKAKSAKEWKKRTALVEIQKKERVKKRNENLANGGKKNKDEKTKTPRAGFEGKKGEGFLNSGDKKSKPADAKTKPTTGGDKNKKK